MEKTYQTKVLIMGKQVTVEVNPGHFGPTTYTILGKGGSIFVFRKIQEDWHQVYGTPFTEAILSATIKALEELHEK